MPVMPRPKGLAKRIAFSVLGVPSNMIKTRKRTFSEKYQSRLTVGDVTKMQR